MNIYLYYIETGAIYVGSFLLFPGKRGLGLGIILSSFFFLLDQLYVELKKSNKELENVSNSKA